MFWIDLEMTGLDDTRDQILEAAVVITDLDFNILEKYQSVVFQPPEIVENMHEWCKKVHGESGLTKEIPQGKPIFQVEDDLLALIGRHFPAQERIVLCGNSVGNDKRFIDHYWKRLAQRLHYRIIDVSSFKEIFREKYGIQFDKKNTHRAAEDIDESVRELSFYTSYVTPKR